MADTRTISEFGNDYKCVSFFCTDRNVGGVDVSRGGEHIGEIIGLEIPDEYDEDFEELVKEFDNEVIEWVIDNELN